MSIRIPRGTPDPTIDAIVECLRPYDAQNPGAKIEVYRQNPVSVRLRVVDPTFKQLSRSERSKVVWPILRQLPDDVLQEISFVILVPPEEETSSMSSREFDDPLPSRF